MHGYEDKKNKRGRKETESRIENENVVFTDFFYLFDCVCVCLGGNKCFVLDCKIVFSWKTVCGCVLYSMCA